MAMNILSRMKKIAAWVLTICICAAPGIFRQ